MAGIVARISDVNRSMQRWISREPGFGSFLGRTPRRVPREPAKNGRNFLSHEPGAGAADDSYGRRGRKLRAPRVHYLSKIDFDRLREPFQK
jgi:hypothetical protein